MLIKQTSHNVNYWVSPMAQQVKNLPEMQEVQVQSLELEDPLEEEMASHSSILARRIPRTEEPDELWSMWLRKNQT